MLLKRIMAGFAVLVFAACVTGQTKIRIGKGHNAVQALNITTTSLPAGQTTVAYSSTVYATGGVKPYTFTVTAGALPDGLSMATTGVISGTPTVANTFNFTVHVVDSTGGTPQTDNQTLSIAISATAPVSPISITTSSIPSATYNIAYSTTLVSSGGTDPDIWSTVSGSGNTPPGTVLASTGVISGTPTASGTFAFTARVTDSSSPAQTNDKAFSITVAAGSPTYLFSDAFESGNFAAWTTTKSATVQSTTKYSGTYAAEFHYAICGDSSNPACGSTSQDNNRWVDKRFDTGLTTAYARGYFYFGTPLTTPAIAQRKIIRISDNTSANPTPYTWEVELNPWQGSGGNPDSLLHMAVTYAGTGCGATNPNTTIYNRGDISFNAWHSIELGVIVNTAGVADGTVKVWIDGVLGYSNTAVKVRGDCTTGMTNFNFGSQTNRYSYNPVDEYRYLDDVIINGSYIGP